MTGTNEQLRRSVLSKMGASEVQVEKLLEYNSNIFNYSNLEDEISFPLDDEPFIKSWKKYETDAASLGVLPAIKKALPQLNFPIDDKIGDNPEYKDAVLFGNITKERLDGDSLKLTAPENMQLAVIPNDAGSIPMIYIPKREDFVSMFQALKTGNTTREVPVELTSAIVRDLRNSDRIMTYKERFLKKKSLMNLSTSWLDEFNKLLPKKELYLDSFIIICGGDAANVKHDDIGIPKDEWIADSIVINREKEVLKYYFKRIFQVEKNHPYIELITNYHAIKTALNKFTAETLLKIMIPKPDSTLPACGLGVLDEKFKPETCEVIKKLIIAAANNLEQFEKIYRNELEGNDNNLLLISFTYLTLEELASNIEPLEKIYFSLV